MSAVIRACTTSSQIKNTGTGSNLFPAATAMLIICDKKFKFTLDDLNNPDILSAFTEWVHADPTDKVYPLFGNQIPISGIVNTKGTDNTVTLDNGEIIFVSYTQYAKLFSTTDGGLCFAKVLKSFNNADMRVMEVDIKGNLVCKDNHDGTYSGLKASLFAPAIDMSDLKNPAKSYFQLGYMPDYFVDNAVMLNDAAPLLDLMGLLDLKFTAVGTQTPTVLKVDLVDECCGDDVLAEYGADLVAIANSIVVTDAATGAVIAAVPTIAGGLINLTGVFATGKSYVVSAIPPSELAEGEIYGVEIAPATVAVP